MANLLPKSKSDFASKDYWDKFFTQRTSAFEWYGEYHQLSPIIFKYAKSVDRLLVLGCGNSSMSNDLNKSGYSDVISIDISDVVIKQMQKRYPKLDFRKMDATKLEFSDNEIVNVIDKGTIDALLPNLSSESVNTVESIFREVSRVLKFGGRFLCVTLLQNHVAETLFNFFQTKTSEDVTWIVRIHRCLEAEDNSNDLTLPVYVLVASKMKRLPVGPCVFETIVGDGKPVRHSTIELLHKEIKDQQNYAFLQNHISKSTLDEEIKTELFSSKGEDQTNPKYELFIVDSPDLNRCELKFACFIVPEGREAEWLFGTPEGRKVSAKQCQCSRVVFVHLSRHFKFLNMEQIQDELSGAIRMLAPKNLKSGARIPFLSIGESAGTRTVVESGRSELSGEYVVEDVKIGDDYFRSLIFLARKSVYQTQVKISKKKKVDFSYLASEYYKYMVSALGCFKEHGKALLLGLGGGSLASFVAKFTQWKVEAVELDPTVLEIARKHFSLSESIITHVEDAKKFVFASKEKFDVIWLDIDSKDVEKVLTCPPEEFLTDDFLEGVKRIMNSNALFVINLACRDDAKCQQVLHVIGTKFCYVKYAEVPEDINKVVFASQDDLVCDFEGIRQLLKKSHKDNDIEDLAENFKSVGIK